MPQGSGQSPECGKVEDVYGEGGRRHDKSMEKVVVLLPVKA